METTTLLIFSNFLLNRNGPTEGTNFVEIETMTSDEAKARGLSNGYICYEIYLSPKELRRYRKFGWPP